MPDLQHLIELLRKIEATPAHVKIEVNYNGEQFYWSVMQQGITADEWIPPKSKGEHKSRV